MRVALLVFALLFEPFEWRDALLHGLDHSNFFAERPRGNFAASFGLALKNVGYVGVVLGCFHGFRVMRYGSAMSQRAQNAVHFLPHRSLRCIGLEDA